MVPSRELREERVTLCTALTATCGPLHPLGYEGTDLVLTRLEAFPEASTAAPGAVCHANGRRRAPHRRITHLCSTL